MNSTTDHKPESPGLVQILVSVYFWISIFLVPGLIFPYLLLVWLGTVLFDRPRLSPVAVVHVRIASISNLRRRYVSYCL